MSRPVRVHEVRVDGQPLICRLHGRGPLCVVHPSMPGGYLRMPLAERELTMAYLDGPASAEHLHAVIEHLAGDPVFLLGHGSGGFAAQKYALAHPDRPAGLILYSTGAVADAAAARDRLRDYAVANAYAPALAAWDRRRPEDLFPAYFADYWRRKAEFEPVRDRMRAWPLPAAPFDVRAALPSITTPTLVLAGAHDPFFPPAAADTLHDGIPGARLAVFRHSAHLAHLEESERFTHLLLEFTRRLAGPYRAPRR
ncbi:alpha/beta hydrolase [Actinoplanes sp. NPDC049596]|uniref:alpha/beta fold hydrolase n=1 Tax=unclassified Actinoplanes TaxID=2626549 RepID=UPI003425FC43